MADPPRREGASVLRQDEGVRLLKVEADTDKTGGESKLLFKGTSTYDVRSGWGREYEKV